MKKYLILFFTASLTLSCSTNSEGADETVDEIDETSTKTPKNVQYQGQNIAFDLVVFNYDIDGKLLTAEDSSIGYVQEYVYSGDILTGIKNYTNNVLGSQQVYEYSNGLISKLMSYNSNNELTRTRTHIYSNGILQSYTDQYTNSANPDTTWDYEYNQSENSIKRIKRDDPLNFEITTYDRNKKPFYNVPSLVLIDKSVGNVNSNNIIETVSYFNGSINNTRTHTNTYDSDDFLTSISVISNGAIERTETYTYNE